MVLFSLGIALLAVSFIITVPGNVKTFLGIPYATAPEYALTLTIKTSLMLTGLIFTLISLLYVFFDFRSSRSIEDKSSKSVTDPNKQICVFCGAENPRDSFYCLKCAKKIRTRNRER